MKKYYPLPSRKGIIMVFAFLLVILVFGMFMDYPVSKALYNESNPFGIFMAAYGEYPALLGFLAAGTLLICGHNRKKKVIGALQVTGGVILVLLGVLMAAMMPTRYLPLPETPVKVIGVLCAAGVVTLTVLLCRKAEPGMAVRVAAVIFFTIFVEMLVVNIIKIPWGRARMRLVANDPRAYFMPCWQVGGELKNILIAAGVAAEEFKSFPSGHTANATMLALLGLLPLLKPEWADKKNLLFGIGFLWAALVAFSCIIMGAHYLTDTTMGFAVGFTTILVMCRIVFRKGAGGESGAVKDAA